ncbi:MAG: ROK family protein [Verrucomicrobia bacterium]|nr:ROK family protein [Verrucomicrobiota bacterium]
MDPHYLGIEIGGTKLQFVLGNSSAAVVQRWRFPVDRHRGGAGIREQIASALPGILAKTETRGIGVGFGGPVDWKTGQICCSHQIEGWTDFQLGTWLQSLASLPVRVDNDANVAALGEALHGAGRGLNPVFYVTLGSGVGGGFVSDGRIYHGAKPGESEIGHVRLDRSGTIVEGRCSGWAVDARIRESIRKAPAGVLAQLAGKAGGSEARFLAAALAQGDTLAQCILRELAEDLAFGLSHVVHLFHPEIIAIGGGLSSVGEPLRAAVAESLAVFVMEAFQPGPKLALAALGEDAVPVGALALARLISP